MNYADAIEFIQSFPDLERGTFGSFTPTMSLDAMKEMLQLMGDPQDNRPTIHITGSKGKGSTSTMLASILTHAPFHTALYTSPHIHSYQERISFDLQPVSEKEFAAGMDAIRPFLDAIWKKDSQRVATFGILTALFFYLAKTRQPKTDWQVVEVGLGGAKDTTNVFSQKELAIITPISLEHTQILGDTVTDIAKDKSGIITPGCTVILAAQKDPAVKKVVAHRCRELKCELVDVEETYSFELNDIGATKQTFTLHGPHGPSQLQTSLLGPHQIVNAATAVAAADSLIRRGVQISESAIFEGLRDAKLPGRFELFTVDSSDPHVVVLDGAHNRDSAAALVSALRTFFGDTKWTFILGVNQDKKVESIFEELSPLCSSLIATRSQNIRGMEPKAVLAKIKGTKISTDQADSVSEAFVKARGKFICVTGSLYVVAEARELLVSNPA